MGLDFCKCVWFFVTVFSAGVKIQQPKKKYRHRQRPRFLYTQLGPKRHRISRPPPESPEHDPPPEVENDAYSGEGDNRGHNAPGTAYLDRLERRVTPKHLLALAEAITQKLQMYPGGPTYAVYVATILL